MTPDVSVVIAYYRNQATLPDQLDALVGQSTDRPFEVIIADNEGSAELEEIARGYAPVLNIRTIPAYDAPGQCHARNLGVRFASARYVALCDADDIVSDTWVDALCRTLDSDDVLATGPLRLDRINPDFAWHTNVNEGLSAAAPSNLTDGPVLVGTIPYLSYLNFAFGCNIGIRRDTFLRLGGMDERHIGGSEDVDFSWRAQESGVLIVENPDALIDYRLRQGVREIFAQRRRYSRAQLRLWGISRDLGRPVRGMSLRWAVGRASRLPIEYLRLRGADTPTRYAFAFRAGGVVGTLEGQIMERILVPRILSDARQKLTARHQR